MVEFNERISTKGASISDDGITITLADGTSFPVSSNRIAMLRKNSIMGIKNSKKPKLTISECKEILSSGKVSNLTRKWYKLFFGSYGLQIGNRTLKHLFKNFDKLDMNKVLEIHKGRKCVTIDRIDIALGNKTERIEKRLDLIEKRNARKELIETNKQKRISEKLERIEKRKTDSILRAERKLSEKQAKASARAMQDKIKIEMQIKALQDKKNKL